MGWGDWAQLAVQAYGAYSGSKAQKDAASSAGKQAQQGTDASNKLIWDMFQQNRQDQQPIYQAGLQAQDRYLQLMGLQPTSQFAGQAQQPQQPQTPFNAADAYLQANPDVAASNYFKSRPQEHYTRYGKSEGREWATAPQAATQPAALTPTPALSQSQAFDAFRNQPGYQFGMDQGLKSVQSSAAARGGLSSGATLKSLFKFGNDYADQQGFTPYMNRLSGLFGGAQTAAGQMGSYGQGAASQMGQNTIAGANARAQSTYAAGQAKAQTINDFGYGINKYGTQQGWWG